MNNGRPGAEGGWAILAAHAGSIEVIDGTLKYGKLRAGQQTNNRAELEAMYQGLLLIDSMPSNYLYNVWSDSEIAVKGVNGESSRNAYRDIWEQIEILCKKLVKERKINKHSVQYIDGHNNKSEEIHHILNCLCDKYAKIGANSLLLEA
jgi:ribonuclease HI